MSNEKTEDQFGLVEMTVEISTEGGTRSVPGLIHKACPGLAVTMHPFGVFQVTHTKTGLKLCSLYQRASKAILAMSWWALIADMEGQSWEDVGTAEASVMISKAKDKPVPFDDCTSTSQGETRKMTVGEWFQHQRMPLFDEFPWEERDPFELAINNLEKIGVPA